MTPFWHEKATHLRGKARNSLEPQRSTSVCESTGGTGNWSTLWTKTMENNGGKQRLA